MKNLQGTLKYSIQFHRNLKISQKTCIQKIRSVLNDTRGWKKLGYCFEYQKHYQKSDSPPVDFVIHFTSSQWIAKFCNLPGLSCTDLRTNDIYINIDNWRRGSANSHLSLDNYRTYLINHEVGHVLGRGHTRCSSPFSKVPVMMQQTLGIGMCLPNPWPLNWE